METKGKRGEEEKEDEEQEVEKEEEEEEVWTAFKFSPWISCLGHGQQLNYPCKEEMTHWWLAFRMFFFDWPLYLRLG